MLKQILNLLFPLKCAVCGQTADAEICPSCRELTPYLETSQLEIQYPYCGIFKYDEKARKIIKQIKYQKNRELIPFIQQEILLKAPKIEADILIPVPLNPLRQKERGFNQAKEFFLRYATYHKIEIRPDIVYRGTNTQKLAALSHDQRDKETADIFQVWENKQKFLADKRILISDDIITTGSTIRNLADVLSKCNPKSIEIIGVFRPSN